MTILTDAPLKLNPSNLPTKFQLEKNLCERSLYWFTKLAWHVLNPDPFIDNWHIKAICDYLEAVYKGDIRFLTINIPPRMGKSSLVNVYFYLWSTIQKPSIKFMYVASNEELATRDSNYCRDVIKSDWFRSFWPHITIKKDHDQKLSFGNVYGGYRMSFGINSGFTGQGADIICCDDLNDPRTVYSDTIRDGINQTFDEKISNRFNDPKKGRMVNIQQRLHLDDITGHILNSDNKHLWESLVLPMEKEKTDRFISSIGFEDTRKTGELLWPERYGETEAARDKAQGELYWNQQFQQRPSPLSGNIYQRKWFINRQNNNDVVARFLSFDTASSISQTAAYSSVCVGEMTSNYQLFIREVNRQRLEFPQLNDYILEYATKYKDKLQGIFIENKSSGISVLQSLQQTAEPWIQELLIPVNIKKDDGKETRAISASVYCEKDCILLPPPTSDFPWLADFEQELFNFPASKFKDQVDAFNQLIMQLELWFIERLRYQQQLKEGN